MADRYAIRSSRLDPTVVAQLDGAVSYKVPDIRVKIDMSRWRSICASHSICVFDTRYDAYALDICLRHSICASHEMGEDTWFTTESTECVFGDCPQKHIFDRDGNAVDENEATRCVINEYKNTGELVCTTYGVIRSE